MPVEQQKRSLLQAFTSLVWYDGVIEFLFRFVAKTSEPLLALGLVISAAEVLTKGRLMHNNLALSDAWAWTQALAIESSGGVVLVYALQSFKQRDTVKGWLYMVLAGLLAIVGGMMLYSQLLSNATGAPDFFASGAWQVQVFVVLRVIVSVGYVVMCRTKHIRFNDLSEPDAPAVSGTQQLTISDETIHRLVETVQQLTFTVTKITTEHPAIVLPAIPERTASERFTDVPSSQELTGTADERSDDDEASSRLAVEYRKMVATFGSDISASALAAQAHVRKATAIEWLRRQQESESVA